MSSRAVLILVVSIAVVMLVRVDDARGGGLFRRRCRHLPQQRVEGSYRPTDGVISLGARPSGMLCHDGRVFVASWRDRQILVFDETTGVLCTFRWHSVWRTCTCTISRRTVCKSRLRSPAGTSHFHGRIAATWPSAAGRFLSRSDRIISSRSSMTKRSGSRRLCRWATAPMVGLIVWRIQPVIFT